MSSKPSWGALSAALLATVLAGSHAGADAVVLPAAGEQIIRVRIDAPEIRVEAGTPSYHLVDEVLSEIDRAYGPQFDFIYIFPNIPTELSRSGSTAAALFLGSRLPGGESIRGLGVPSGPALARRSPRQGVVLSRSLASLGLAAGSWGQDQLQYVLYLLAHETAHRWTGGPAFRRINGQTEPLYRSDGLGSLGHYVPWLSSNSVQHGQWWAPHGPGRFIRLQVPLTWSDLDLYLMGLLPPEQVAPMTIVRTTELTADDDVEPGRIITGLAETVEIGDIIRALGPRSPSHLTAQRSFRGAFVVLESAAAPVDPQVLGRLETLRAAWARQFHALARGHAVMALETTSAVSVLGGDEEAVLGRAYAYLTGRRESDGGWPAPSPALRVAATASALRLVGDLLDVSDRQQSLAWLAQQQPRDLSSLVLRAEALAQPVTAADMRPYVVGDWYALSRGGPASIDALTWALRAASLASDGREVARLADLISAGLQSSSTGVRLLSGWSNPGLPGIDARATIAALAALGPLISLPSVQDVEDWYPHPGRVCQSPELAAGVLLSDRYDDRARLLGCLRDRQRADGSWNGDVGSTLRVVEGMQHADEARGVLAATAFPYVLAPGSNQLVVRAGIVHPQNRNGSTIARVLLLDDAGVVVGASSDLLVTNNGDSLPVTLPYLHRGAGGRRTFRAELISLSDPAVGPASLPLDIQASHPPDLYIAQASAPDLRTREEGRPVTWAFKVGVRGGGVQGSDLREMNAAVRSLATGRVTPGYYSYTSGALHVFTASMADVEPGAAYVVEVHSDLERPETTADNTSAPLIPVAHPWYRDVAVVAADGLLARPACSGTAVIGAQVMARGVTDADVDVRLTVAGQTIRAASVAAAPGPPVDIEFSVPQWELAGGQVRIEIANAGALEGGGAAWSDNARTVQWQAPFVVEAEAMSLTAPAVLAPGALLHVTAETCLATPDPSSLSGTVETELVADFGSAGREPIAWGSLRAAGPVHRATVEYFHALHAFDVAGVLRWQLSTAAGAGDWPGDNSAETALAVLSPEMPDLVLRVPPPSRLLNVGLQERLPWTVVNAGGTATGGPVELELRAGSNTILAQIPDLAAGASVTGEMTLRIPDVPELLMHWDLDRAQALVEAERANNVAVHRVYMARAPNPRIGLRLPSSDGALPAGQPITIAARLDNTGGQPTGNMQVTWSLDAQGGQWVGDIPSGAHVVIPITLAGLPAGSYSLAVSAEPLAAEPNWSTTNASLHVPVVDAGDPGRVFYFSPNGDGARDRWSIAAGNVERVEIRTAWSGRLIYDAVVSAEVFSWDGRWLGPGIAPDDRYRVLGYEGRDRRELATVVLDTNRTALVDTAPQDLRVQEDFAGSGEYGAGHLMPTWPYGWYGGYFLYTSASNIPVGGPGTYPLWGHYDGPGVWRLDTGEQLSASSPGLLMHPRLDTIALVDEQQAVVIDLQAGRTVTAPISAWVFEEDWWGLSEGAPHWTGDGRFLVGADETRRELWAVDQASFSARRVFWSEDLIVGLYPGYGSTVVVAVRDAQTWRRRLLRVDAAGGFPADVIGGEVEGDDIDLIAVFPSPRGDVELAAFQRRIRQGGHSQSSLQIVLNRQDGRREVLIDWLDNPVDENPAIHAAWSADGGEASFVTVELAEALPPDAWDFGVDTGSLPLIRRAWFVDVEDGTLREGTGWQSCAVALADVGPYFYGGDFGGGDVGNACEGLREQGATDGRSTARLFAGGVSSASLLDDVVGYGAGRSAAIWRVQEVPGDRQAVWSAESEGELRFFTPAYARQRGDRLQFAWSSEGGGPDDGLYSLTSLDNLWVDLQAAVRDDGVLMALTATDRHLDYWLLEYREVGAGDVWTRLDEGSAPLRAVELTGWAPPAPGVFELRLSAVDRAGNTAQSLRTIVWLVPPPLVTWSRADWTAISPNGDGVQDSLRIDFDVSGAGTVQVRVAPASATAPVRSLDMAVAEAGRRVFVWDGNDDAATPVADGDWVVSVAGRTHNVVVDRVPPVLQAAVTGPVVFCGEILSEAQQAALAARAGALVLREDVRLFAEAYAPPAPNGTHRLGDDNPWARSFAECSGSPVSRGSTNLAMGFVASDERSGLAAVSWRADGVDSPVAQLDASPQVARDAVLVSARDGATVARDAAGNEAIVPQQVDGRVQLVVGNAEAAVWPRSVDAVPAMPQFRVPREQNRLSFDVYWTGSAPVTSIVATRLKGSGVLKTSLASLAAGASWTRVALPLPAGAFDAAFALTAVFSGGATQPVGSFAVGRPVLRCEQQSEPSSSPAPLTYVVSAAMPPERWFVAQERKPRDSILYNADCEPMAGTYPAGSPETVRLLWDDQIVELRRVGDNLVAEFPNDLPCRAWAAVEAVWPSGEIRRTAHTAYDFCHVVILDPQISDLPTEQTLRVADFSQQGLTSVTLVARAVGPGGRVAEAPPVVLPFAPGTNVAAAPLHWPETPWLTEADYRFSLAHWTGNRASPPLVVRATRFPDESDLGSAACLQADVCAADLRYPRRGKYFLPSADRDTTTCGQPWQRPTVLFSGATALESVGSKPADYDLTAEVVGALAPFVPAWSGTSWSELRMLLDLAAAGPGNRRVVLRIARRPGAAVGLPTHLAMEIPLRLAPPTLSVAWQPASCPILRNGKRHAQASARWTDTQIPQRIWNPDEARGYRQSALSRTSDGWRQDVLLNKPAAPHPNPTVLNLQILDANDNLLCLQSPPLLPDLVVQHGPLSVAPPLLSPLNVDGVYDLAMAGLLAGESLRATMHLRRPGEEVAQIVAGPQDVAAESGFDVVLDGRDGGDWLADGVYTVAADLEDACLNRSKSTTELRIDNSAPQIAVLTPVGGAAVLSGGPVPIVLSVTDADGSGVQMVRASVLQGGQPDPLVLVRQDSTTWRGHWAPATDGTALLQVAATDRAGNAATAEAAFVTVAADLIAAATLSESWLSPNGDGRQDAVRAEVSLRYPADITLQVRPGDGGPATLWLETQESGVRAFDWSGDTAFGPVPDGMWILELIASRTVGAVTVTESVAWPLGLDRVPPVLTLDPDAAVLDGSLATWSLYADDAAPITRIEAHFESGPSRVIEDAAHLDIPMHAIPEGRHTVEFVARDAAGNETVLTRQVAVDRTAPVWQSFTASPNPLPIGEDLHVHGAVTDLTLAAVAVTVTVGTETLAAGVDLAADGSFVARITADQLQRAEGALVIEAWAHDRLGYGSGTSTVVALQRPEVYVQLLSPPALVSDAVDVTARIESEYALQARLLVSPSGEERWSTLWSMDDVTGGVHNMGPFPVLPDGTYLLRLRADSVAGEGVTTAVVRVDRTPPPSPVWDTVGAVSDTVSLAWATVEPGARYEVWRDDSRVAVVPWASWSETQAVDGVYVYRLRALDEAGHRSPFGEAAAVRVDRTAPIVEFRSPAPLTMHRNSPIAVQVVAFDQPGDEIMLTLSSSDGVELKQAARHGEPMAFAYSPVGGDGPRLLRVTATDPAGITSATELALLVDRTPPLPPGAVTSAPAGTWSRVVDWAPSPSSDVVGYAVSVYLIDPAGQVVEHADEPGLAVAGPVEIYLLGDGRHRVEVAAVDAAGWRTPAAAEWIVDNSAPAIYIREPDWDARFHESVDVAYEASADVTAVHAAFFVDGEWLEAGIEAPSGRWQIPWPGGPESTSTDLRLRVWDSGGRTGERERPLSHADDRFPDGVLTGAAAIDGATVSLDWQWFGDAAAGAVVLRRRSDQPLRAPTEVGFAPPGVTSFVDTLLWERELSALERDEPVYWDYWLAPRYAEGRHGVPTPIGRVRAYWPEWAWSPAMVADEAGSLTLAGARAEPMALVTVSGYAAGQWQPFGAAFADELGRFAVAVTLPEQDLTELRATAQTADGHRSGWDPRLPVAAARPLAPPAPHSGQIAVAGGQAQLSWQGAGDVWIAHVEGLDVASAFVPTDAGLALAALDDPWAGPLDLAPIMDDDEGSDWLARWSPMALAATWTAPALVTTVSAVFRPGAAPDRVRVWALPEGESGPAVPMCEAAVVENRTECVMPATPIWRGMRWEGRRDSGGYDGFVIADIQVAGRRLLDTPTLNHPLQPNQPYTASIHAVGSGGGPSPALTIGPYGEGATSAPPPPDGLLAVLQGPDVLLSWTASATTAVVGYELSRLAGPTVALPATATSRLDRWVPDGEQTYRLVGIDVHGHRSAPAEAAVVVTYPAPAAPAWLAVNADPQGVDLQWLAPPAEHRTIIERDEGQGFVVLTAVDGAQWRDSTTRDGDTSWRLRAVDPAGRIGPAGEPRTLRTTMSALPLPPARFAVPPVVGRRDADSVSSLLVAATDATAIEVWSADQHLATVPLSAAPVDEWLAGGYAAAVSIYPSPSARYVAAVTVSTGAWTIRDLDGRSIVPLAAVGAAARAIWSDDERFVALFAVGTGLLQIHDLHRPGAAAMDVPGTVAVVEWGQGDSLHVVRLGGAGPELATFAAAAGQIVDQTPLPFVPIAMVADDALDRLWLLDGDEDATLWMMGDATFSAVDTGVTMPLDWAVLDGVLRYARVRGPADVVELVSRRRDGYTRIVTGAALDDTVPLAGLSRRWSPGLVTFGTEDGTWTYALTSPWAGGVQCSAWACVAAQPAGLRRLTSPKVARALLPVLPHGTTMLRLRPVAPRRLAVRGDDQLAVHFPVPLRWLALRTLPESALPGEQVTVDGWLVNDGPVPLADVEVQPTAAAAEGVSARSPTLEPGARLHLTGTLTAPLTPGAWSLTWQATAWVDGRRLVLDGPPQSLSVVTDSAGPLLSLRASPAQLPADDWLSVSVVVAASAAVGPRVIDLELIDEEGIATRIATWRVTLDAGAGLTRTVSWPAADLRPGVWRAVATLRDPATGSMETAVAGVERQGDVRLFATIAHPTTVAAPGAALAGVLRVASDGDSAARNVRADIWVEDGLGRSFEVGSFGLPDLAPGSRLTVPFEVAVPAWPDMTVRTAARLHAGDLFADAAPAAWQIVPLPYLVADIAAPATVPTGGSATIAAQVRNLGGPSAAPRTLTLRRRAAPYPDEQALIEMPSDATVVTWSLPASWLGREAGVDAFEVLDDQGARLAWTQVEHRDTVAPVVTMLSPLDGQWAQGVVLVDLLVEDGHSAVVSCTVGGDVPTRSVAFTGGSRWRECPLLAEPTQDGPVVLLAAAVDAAGNVGRTQAVVQIDRTPPVVAVQGVVDGGLYGGPVTLTIDIHDNAPAWSHVTLDGRPLWPTTWVEQEPGLHVLVAEAQDQAGNHTVLRRTWWIEPPVSEPAPDVWIEAVAAGAVTSAAVPVAVHVDPPSAVTALVVTLNGQPQGATFVVDAEGDFVVRAAVTTSGGTAAAERAFTVDRTPPSLSYGGVSDGTVTAGPVTVTVAASDLHLDSMTAHLNGMAFTDVTEVTAPGLHTLQLAARDLAGNTAVTTAAFVIVPPPSATWVTDVTSPRGILVFARCGYPHCLEAGICPPSGFLPAMTALADQIGAGRLTVVEHAATLMAELRTGRYGIVVVAHQLSKADLLELTMAVAAGVRVVLLGQAAQAPAKIGMGPQLIRALAHGGSFSDGTVTEATGEPAWLIRESSAAPAVAWQTNPAWNWCAGLFAGPPHCAAWAPAAVERRWGAGVMLSWGMPWSVPGFALTRHLGAPAADPPATLPFREVLLRIAVAADKVTAAPYAVAVTWDGDLRPTGVRPDLSFMWGWEGVAPAGVTAVMELSARLADEGQATVQWSDPSGARLPVTTVVSTSPSWQALWDEAQASAAACSWILSVKLAFIRPASVPTTLWGGSLLLDHLNLAWSTVFPSRWGVEACEPALQAMGRLAAASYGLHGRLLESEP